MLRTLPIIMLHQVRNTKVKDSEGWSISHNKFLNLVNYLEDNQYYTTSFAELIQDKTTVRSQKRKVILTFDDGYRHLQDFVVPELMKRKMKGVFYIPTAHIGSYNIWDMDKHYPKMEIMNSDELIALDAAGMEIGSHSHNHVRLKQINDFTILENELVLSKQILESIIQKPVYSLAYPYGSVPNDYKKVMSKAGYNFGLCIYQANEGCFALRRSGYFEGDTIKSLKLKLSVVYKYLRMIHDLRFMG